MTSQWLADTQTHLRKPGFDEHPAQTANDLRVDITYNDSSIGPYHSFGSHLPDGEVVITFSDGKEYRGPIENGTLNGRGTMTWSDGMFYVGDFLDGAITGRGDLFYADGKHYQGWLVEGEPEGYGVYTLANGVIHAGEFKNGLAHGQGFRTSCGDTAEILCEDLGCWYSAEGSFENGRFVQGVQTINALIKQGKFKDGKLEDENGRVYSKESGTEWVGRFSKGIIKEGLIACMDSHMYAGEIADNVPHGFGTLLSIDGRLLTGTFNHWSKFHGTILSVDGDQYVGDAYDCVPHGHGVYRFHDGRVLSGIFHHGEFVEAEQN